MAYTKYSPEDKKHIFETVTDAKKNHLDAKVVYISLGEKYDVSPEAIQYQYNDYIKKLNKPKNEDSKSAISLVQKMKSIIKERDSLKESAQVYKEQRDDLQKSYNSLKSDHEKLLKELASLEELLNS